MFYKRFFGLFKKNQVDKEEEKEIFEQYQNGNFYLEEKIVKKYFYIVFMVVSSIKKTNSFFHFKFDDLMQEGFFGLIKAIRTFNLKKGARFFSYAQKLIKRHLYNILKNKEALVYIPEYIYRRARKVRNLTQDFLNDHGGINFDLIANRFNLSKSEIITLLQTFKKTISLDRTFLKEDNENYSYYDFLENEGASNQFSVFQKNEMKEKIDKAMECLSPRERTVLILRFGLFDTGQEMTLNDIGEKLGLTKQGIKKIEERALKKIKYNLKDLKENSS